jgi:hypothetical protein
MAQAGAVTARVEKVTVVIGLTTLADSYRPTGQGWTAARAGSLITWTPLGPPQCPPSCSAPTRLALTAPQHPRTPN